MLRRSLPCSLAPLVLATALTGCVAGAPADVGPTETRPVPAEIVAHPAYQCLARHADDTVPLCDGRYSDGVRSGRTLLPTAPVRSVSGDAWTMPGYHEPSGSFEARWGGARAMPAPIGCGPGCSASTLLRFVGEHATLELAVGIALDELSGIAEGTAVRVTLHDGIDVRRADDGSLLLAALEDHAPSLRPGAAVPRRSFGVLSVEADEEPVCHGFTAARSWTCAKLYDVDALLVRGASDSVRLEPGQAATIATEAGTFRVRHRYGAHRIQLDADAACASCTDAEAALLSYEIVRVE